MQELPTLEEGAANRARRTTTITLSGLLTQEASQAGPAILPVLENAILSLLLRVAGRSDAEEQYRPFLRDLRVAGISACLIGGESFVCEGSAGPTL